MCLENYFISSESIIAFPRTNYWNFKLFFLMNGQASVGGDILLAILFG